LGLEQKKRVYFPWSAYSQRRYWKVLGGGHLKLDFAEWKDFLEQELVVQARAPS
jgi:hypothetical protein